MIQSSGEQVAYFYLFFFLSLPGLDLCDSTVTEIPMAETVPSENVSHTSTVTYCSVPRMHLAWGERADAGDSCFLCTLPGLAEEEVGGVLHQRRGVMGGMEGGAGRRGFTVLVRPSVPFQTGYICHSRRCENTNAHHPLSHSLHTCTHTEKKKKKGEKPKSPSFPISRVSGRSER